MSRLRVRPPCAAHMRAHARLALAGLSLALLVGGGLLYVAFRSENLAMFQWFAWLGIAPQIVSVRSVFNPFKSGLPDWIYMSLPTTLWMLSCLSMLACVWYGSPGSRGRQWAASFFAACLSSEVAQTYGAIPGTFDPLDLAVMSLGIPFIAFWRPICGAPVMHK